MKNMIILLFLLIGGSVESQTITVKGIQKHCKTDKKDIKDRQLSITQSDSIIIENVKTSSGEFLIEGLEEGLYKFQYKNIFGQTVDKEIALRKNQDTVILCIDELIETNENTLFSTLKTNDRLTITYTLMGCFDFRNEKLEFFYKNDKLFAELYVEDKLEKTKELELLTLDYLIEFETKVKLMKNNTRRCTTSELYVFSLNNKNEFSAKDSSCDWSGYQELKNEIFN